MYSRNERQPRISFVTKLISVGFALSFVLNIGFSSINLTQSQRIEELNQENQSLDQEISALTNEYSILLEEHNALTTSSSVEALQGLRDEIDLKDQLIEDRGIRINQLQSELSEARIEIGRLIHELEVEWASISGTAISIGVPQLGGGAVATWIYFQTEDAHRFGANIVDGTYSLRVPTGFTYSAHIQWLRTGGIGGGTCEVSLSDGEGIVNGRLDVMEANLNLRFNASF